MRLRLEDHASLSAFFVRRLVDGARPFPGDPTVLPSPCDGRLQASDPIEAGTILQAKGRPYSIAELLGPIAERVDLEGGHAWTIYLSPRDYHRVHSPEDARLSDVAWMPGERYSVAPKVLDRREKVLSVNERCVMLLETAGGPLVCVMVGAYNVGRIRVVGVPPDRDGPPDPPPRAEARRGAGPLRDGLHGGPARPARRPEAGRGPRAPRADPHGQRDRATKLSSPAQSYSTTVGSRRASRR